MKTIIFLLSLSAISLNVLSSDDSSFARYPALNMDGSVIAFSYQGDIWTVPIDGGKASRITIHQGYESNPSWNPDGRRIAFSSNRFGQNDLFIIDSEGGLPQRITHHSAGDILTDWSQADNLVFGSSRNFKHVERESELLSIASGGGTPVRLMDALGSEPVVSPDGRFVAFIRGSCRIPREAYQGSANRDIWLYHTEKNTFSQLTRFEGQDYHPVWGSNQSLYFISARSGKYNIFSFDVDETGQLSSEPVQITNEDNDQIRFFDVSADDQSIVYEKDINLYSISTAGGESKKINIDIATDYRFDPYENKVFKDQVGGYQVSPDGKYSAFVIHGEVFITENHKEKSLTRNLSNSPYREKDIAWLHDSALIFSSDRDGRYNLYLVKSSDPDQANLFKTLKRELVQLTSADEDERSPVVSPNGKQIAFIRGGNYGKMNFIVADIDPTGTISNEKIQVDSWNAPSGVRWSPDSKWLAYALEDLTFNAEIYIQAADGSKEPVNVSMHPRRDRSPVWSPDGSKLGFISTRNNLDDDIWFVWLRKEDSQKTKQDWEEEEEDDPRKSKGKKGDEDNGGDNGENMEKDKEDVVEPLKIDFEDIHERLVQLTSLSGNEGNLAISTDGKTFYFTTRSPGKKGSDLFQINWDGKDMKEVTKGGKNPNNVKLDPKGKYLYMNTKGKLSRISTNGKELENLPVAAKMKIDYQAELNQVFEEAWRALRDGFYDPEFHGRDWDGLKAKFKPYCMEASTKTDFMYMYNIMLGQLNASHMGLYGRDREKIQSERTGFLGIDILPQNQGVLIKHVIPDSPADKITSTLNAGEIVISVNGDDVTRDINFWSLLANTTDEKVLLGVQDKNGTQREVVIRPVGSLRTELYNEWVKERRRLTDEYSGGRLGYLHIRGMDMRSFERFERELTAVGHGKEGIVIDVRFNGGGSTTDYLMAILNVKQHAYTIPRGADTSLSNHKNYREYYPFSTRLPFFAWNKPSIALCNENSYSNAEIFSHAYKNLGIGTLVGRPTFGAVISTGGVGLIDGSYVRMPFRGWFVKANDMNMDWEPARPDIEVFNSPDHKSKGVDEQLQKACEVLLEQLGE
ncbi:MAG: S41 family peptidase [Bacteroidales bacterium]